LIIPKYSPCPREFELDSSSGDKAILAPFATDGGAPPISF
jgi:hypothetical protein